LRYALSKLVEFIAETNNTSFSTKNLVSELCFYEWQRKNFYSIKEASRIRQIKIKQALGNHFWFTVESRHLIADG